MVYVSPLFATRCQKRWPYDSACLMTADTTDELNAMAALLRLQPHWIQDRHVNARLWHYSLTPNKRAQALRLGAVEGSAAIV